MTPSSVGGRRLWLVGSAWLLGAQALTVLLTAAVLIAAARVLGPQGFGVYSVLTAAVGITAAFTTYRLDMHLVPVLGRSDPPSEAVGDALKTAYLLTAPAAVVGAALALALATGDVRIAAVIAAVELLLTPLGLLRAVLQVRDQQRLIAVSSVTGRLCVLVGTGAVLAAQPSFAVTWVIAARVAALAVEATLLARFARVDLRPWRLVTTPGLHAQRSILRVAFPLAAAGVSGTLYKRVDQLLLAPLRGVAETGLYAAGVRVSELLGLFASVVQNVTLATLVRTHEDGDERGFTNAVRDSMLLMIVPGGLGVAVLAAEGERLTAFVLGPEYEGLGHLLAVLAWSEIAVFLGTVYASAALAAGARGLLAWGTLSGLAVNLVGNGILIPMHGALGAAYATLIAYSVAAVHMGFGASEVRHAAVASLPTAGRLVAAVGVSAALAVVAPVTWGWGLVIVVAAYGAVLVVLFPGDLRRLRALLPARAEVGR